MLFPSFENRFPSGLGASQCSTNSRYGKGWLMISRGLESDVMISWQVHIGYNEEFAYLVSDAAR